MRKPEPESRMSNVVFYQSKGTPFPRSLNITDVWKPTRETQVSTTIGHSGLHDLWGHRANIRPVLPLFFLFSRILSEEKGSGPAPLFLQPSEAQRLRSLPPASQQAVQLGFSSSHLLFPSNSSWRRVAASSSSHQGNLHATQALSSFKLRRNVQQENLNQPLSCTTQQKPTRRFHTTSNGTARTPFFTFSKTVKHLGLMIY